MLVRAIKAGYQIKKSMIRIGKKFSVKNKEKKMKDKCVTCGNKSLYDKEEHIDFRIGYIEGAGQLCLDCYNELYVKKKNKNE